jgi:hypothetical protein
MRFSVVAFFAALLGLTEAAPKPNSRQTQHHTSTKVSYQTELAVEPYHGHVPTTTIRRTQTLAPIIIISTTHPTVIKTRAVVTHTNTKFVKSTTSVTAAANTDTVSITLTEFDTKTKTRTPPPVTSTICTDTTTITTTTTSHIPTVDGFTPIVDTLPTSTAVEVAKRDLVSLERRSPVFGRKDFRYAKSVKCIHEVVVEVIIIEIIIGPPVTKWLPAHTTTATKTDTISVTSTIVPADVSTTVTDSITSTICVHTILPAETDTVTSTNTATASVVSTAYDACATNNIAISPLSSDYGTFAGESVIDVAVAPGSSVTLTLMTQGSVDTPSDCCVLCAQDSSCALVVYEGDACLFYNTGSCVPSENQLTAYLSINGYVGYSMSNGACGYTVGQQWPW